MSGVQRYDVVWREEGYVKVKDVNGPYVLYSDYLKVKKELEDLHESFARSIEARSRGL